MTKTTIKVLGAKEVGEQVNEVTHIFGEQADRLLRTSETVINMGKAYRNGAFYTKDAPYEMFNEGTFEDLLASSFLQVFNMFEGLIKPVEPLYAALDMLYTISGSYDDGISIEHNSRVDDIEKNCTTILHHLFNDSYSGNFRNSVDFLDYSMMIFCMTADTYKVNLQKHIDEFVEYHKHDEVIYHSHANFIARF